jgi:predicted MFS family arabinose efflux permease
LEIAYALFGLGSIGYMTFVVAYLRDNDASPAAIGVFWVALGVSIWLGGKLWANSISKSRSGRLAGLMYLMMAVASSIVLTSTTATALLASGAAFGSVFVAVVAATTHLIRLHVAQEFWTVTLAGFTVWFGVGLTVGSAATGIISDSYGLSAGILVSVIILAAAAVVAALQSAPTELET